MELTFAFLITVIAIYALFGGADFGGGLLEATLGRHPALQKKLQATLSPVWEANHVWLIAVVVIMFVGFPKVYTTMCTVLYLPLSLALLGILLRGSFFTFRKYDPDPGKNLKTYDVVFRVSSVLTPTFFGFMVAATLAYLPQQSTHPDFGYAQLYLHPWLTVMGGLCAIFVNAVFGYLASVFFYGELDTEPDRRVMIRRILYFFLATFVSGGAVLIWGALHLLVDPEKFFSAFQIMAQLVAFAAIVWMVVSLKNGRGWQARFAAGLQTLAFLTGWVHMDYPVFFRFDDGTALTVQNAAAPPITIFWLNIGLVIVLSLVVPLLVYLYRVFQSSPDAKGLLRR
ncbi:cytochrome d ubiquinol oxidase subunit II [Kiritimatiellota bacterium B12222]|nr:cytochrome d ubiquinol oxidase subunit II [Kiritimatiellota bacterium B12222]